MTNNMDLCKKLLNETEFSESATLITANQRLAVHLQYHCQECPHCKTKGYSIQPLSNWLDSIWKATGNSARVLDAFQEQRVWQQIISNSPNLDLLRSDLTAQMVQSAWRLMQQWQIPLTALVTEQSTEETNYFVSWIKDWKKLAAKKNWLTQSELMTALLPPIQKQTLSVATDIVLLGFDELYPQLDNLIKTLQLHSKVRIINHTQSAKNIKTLACQNEEDELYTMARWAKAKIDNNPKARIAFIAPDLQTQREKLLRIFTEIFANKTMLSAERLELPFSISLGKPLSNYPLIQNLLLLLHCAHFELDIYDCSRLLRSPYLIAASSEMLARGALEKKLYQQGEPKILMQSLLARTREQQAAYFCPQLAESLQQFFTLHKQSQDFQSCSAWANHINNLIASLSGLNEIALTSEEFQLNQRWQKLLADFSNLDEHYGEIDFYAAKQILQKLCEQIIFQLQGDEAAPIQILGVLEAAGMQFDYVWLFGMTEQNWPPIQTTNPFIPFALQRQLNMPAANPTQNWHYYQNITTRLCQSGENIIASFAMQQKEQTLTLSPLFKHFTTITKEQLNLTEFISLENWLFQFQALEQLDDFQAPPLMSAEKIVGGSGILKQQAACPFSAFAKYRLAATELETIEAGLNAKERGNLLHVALENIWNTLQDKTALDQLDEVELNKCINKAIATALTEFIKKKPLTLKQRFLAIEKKRLHSLLYAWLKEEKQRSYFKIIAREAALQIKLNGQMINIRVDRIDALEDGSVVILDYKSGKSNSIEKWLGARPDEPQLPLYCLATTQPIAGVAFAQVNLTNIKFEGISLEENILPKVKAFDKINNKLLPPNWQTLRHEWEITLNHLMEDYCNGNAQVAPKDPLKTCEYCELKLLCRTGHHAEPN